MGQTINKPINVSDERLAQMSALRDENKTILDGINSGREALRQEQHKFDVYKNEQNQLIESARKASKIESDNLKAFEAKVSQWEQDHMHQVPQV